MVHPYSFLLNNVGDLVHNSGEEMGVSSNFAVNAPLEGGPFKIGIGGPVGSGKTMLIERLARAMQDSYEIAVVTNDIYTKEDAEFLVRNSVLEVGRILGVETGGCPHTAIREDASANMAAIEALIKRYDNLDFLFVESGGDNLTSSFSPELVDMSIFVIDVAQGEKIPRKGGPGISRSDLLVINKIDLAPYVGADLAVMARDSESQRKGLPFIFTNLQKDIGLEDVIISVERARATHGNLVEKNN